MTAMLRVHPQTRNAIMAIAERDYGGATADEAIRRLVDEHWERKAIAAMDRFREEDPEGWNAYLAEAEALDQALSAPAADPWAST